MIIQNVTYKGKSLANSTALANNIVLQASQKELTLDTKVDNLTNWHGANAYYTVAGGRIFTFEGRIFGATRADRYIGQKWLNDIIVPESDLSNTAEYPITWTDDGGNNLQAQARVYSMPTYSQDIEHTDIINFKFELFSPASSFQGQTKNTANVSFGLYGGALFSNDSNGIFLGKTLMNQTAGGVNITNNGNFAAGCVIKYLGSLPLGITILNTLTQKYYGVNTAVGSIVYDSTKRPTQCTSYGVDVTGYRTPGSQSIMLNPGVNSICFANANNGYDWTATYGTGTVEYYDTYINS